SGSAGHLGSDLTVDSRLVHYAESAACRVRFVFNIPVLSIT
ncbi:MAG: hypothetical protein JWO45_1461, partial [Spartobacteria bacterium]|nr:hypothetical protein [Spartobacteria bacterium]